MAIYRDKLQFYSGDAIDKIVAPKVQRSIYNNGSTSGQTATWQTAKIVSVTFTNPYGKKCFVRGRWSIDGGTTWNTFDSHLTYTFNLHFVGGSPNPPDQLQSGLKAAVSIGVSDSEVKIVTANGHHGTVTFNIGNGSSSYSPTAHTFLVEYELFEVK